MSDLKVLALPAHEKRAISAEALVHPRTLEKYLKGGPVQPMVKVRIERALAERNLAHLAASYQGEQPTPDSK